jgi:glyoxylase-like metal-dependent hydrolase (beta-lactamase superfamily II)
VSVFTLGPYATNCYVLVPAGGSECWIIDASFGPAPIIQAIRRRGLTPKALILTHAHVDHIAGVAEIVAAFPGLPVLIHEAEADWLQDPELNLSAFSGTPVTAPPPTRTLHDGEVLELGGTGWVVIHTPGHSPGGISLHAESLGVAIVGDTLFAGSVGRTDFPGCSFEQLERSIRTRLYTLAAGTRVLPGHGEPTSIGDERRSNPFVSG